VGEHSVDALLVRWRAGDAQALQDLLPLVYEELRRVARRQLRAERPDDSLQTTALIHEAYLRLRGGKPSEVHDHCHFVGLASRLMRQVLVDHARSRSAAKRHGGLKITMNDAVAISDQVEIDVLAADAAMNRLSDLDPQQALRISAATVKRDWTTARAWLRRELGRADPP